MIDMSVNYNRIFEIEHDSTWTEVEYVDHFSLFSPGFFVSLFSLSTNSILSTYSSRNRSLRLL